MPARDAAVSPNVKLQHYHSPKSLHAARFPTKMHPVSKCLIIFGYLFLRSKNSSISLSCNTHSHRVVKNIRQRGSLFRVHSQHFVHQVLRLVEHRTSGQLAMMPQTRPNTDGPSIGTARQGDEDARLSNNTFPPDHMCVRTNVVRQQNLQSAANRHPLVALIASRTDLTTPTRSFPRQSC